MTKRMSLSRPIWMAVVALTLPLASCDIDELLQVTDPDRVSVDTTKDPAFIDVLVTGAIGDFTSAFSGGESYVTVSALLTDETFSTGTFTTRTATDRRLQQSPANGNTSDGTYINLQQARRALMNAIPAVADHAEKGTSHADYSLLNGLYGYSYVLLGEGYCSHIPISNDEAPDPADGPPRTSAELFEASLAMFDGAGSNNLGRIGKGRALMNLGRYSEAAAAVASVPTTWVYHVQHSENAASNTFFGMQGNGRYSISQNEGGSGSGAAFRGAGDGFDNAGQDPRNPWWEDPQGGFDPAFRLFVADKYPDWDSPVVLASGVEARLIEAEAALASGGDWLGKLNALRADVGNLMSELVPSYSVASPSLAPLTDPGTAAARVDMVFNERALWFWGTGHRLGDLRRMVNQYSRTEAQVYPSGLYHKGGSHGADVNFPVDFDEGNNKLYEASQCVTTAATFN